MPNLMKVPVSYLSEKHGGTATICWAKLFELLVVCLNDSFLSMKCVVLGFMCWSSRIAGQQREEFTYTYFQRGTVLYLSFASDNFQRWVCTLLFQFWFKFGYL